MNKKSIVTLSVIIIYVIICGLFIKFFTLNHSSGTRFCSTDTETFSNQFLITEFKKSNSSKLWNDQNFDDSDDIKYLPIYRGRPFCGGLDHVSLDTVVADELYEYNFVSNSCCKSQLRTQLQSTQTDLRPTCMIQKILLRQQTSKFFNRKEASTSTTKTMIINDIVLIRLTISLKDGS